MKKKAFVRLKKKVKELMKEYSIRDMVAEVYNLYQEYLINEYQEEELYRIVDPEDIESSPSELWYSDGYGCAPLYDFAYLLV